MDTSTHSSKWGTISSIPPDIAIMNISKLHEKDLILVGYNNDDCEHKNRFFKFSASTNVWEDLKIEFNFAIKAIFVDGERLYIFANTLVCICDLSANVVNNEKFNWDVTNFLQFHRREIHMVADGNSLNIILDETFNRSLHCVWRNFRELAPVAVTPSVCVSRLVNARVFGTGVFSVQIPLIRMFTRFNETTSRLAASRTVCTDCGRFIVIIGCFGEIFIFDTTQQTVCLSRMVSPNNDNKAKANPNIHTTYQRYRSDEEYVTDGFVCANNRQYPQVLVGAIRQFVSFEWVHLVSCNGHWRINLTQIFNETVVYQDNEGIAKISPIHFD